MPCRYGRQNVPVDPDVEKYMSYHPDKGMQMMGFVAAEAVPRCAEPVCASVRCADRGAIRLCAGVFGHVHQLLKACRYK